MDFGRIPLDLLHSVDFNLPPDGDITPSILTGKKADNPQLYFGGPLWGEKAWLGKIYPAGCKTSDMLFHYAKNFGSIELNATHYKLYGEEQLHKWALQTQSPQFKFCPKITNSISHYADLSSQRAKILTDEFLSSIQGFGSQLGPCFLQLSEKFSPQKKTVLLNYLEQLPRDFKVCVELRHEDWFVVSEEKTHFFRELHRMNIGTVITDVAGRRDCLHMELTAPFAMVRFVANGLHPTDFSRADQWVERIAKWLDSGLHELHFFIHQPNDILVPELTDYFIKQLNARFKFDLPQIRFLDQQGELF